MNNQQTTKELENEKRSQRIDMNRNKTGGNQVEQSQEERKKILDEEETELNGEDERNNQNILEEGNDYFC